jgi:glycerophosphoryl diester phosphodiesterase
MHLPLKFKKILLRVIDGFYSLMPQPCPASERLKNCKIISHRGEYNNSEILENTIAAFDKALSCGIWGVEFDVRWTRDLQPVVFHDMDCQRLFGSELVIQQVTFAQLQKAFPVIPLLAEVIQKFGKKMHLMVEIKKEVYPEPAYQKRILRDLFSTLEPEKDYHFLALHPEMFRAVDFLPPSTFLPIARLNLRELSAMSIHENFGGIAGHYSLLTDEMISKHKKHGQQVGTGYVGSKNCLFRELNRGVDWIFSNNASEIQSLVHSLSDAR